MTLSIFAALLAGLSVYHTLSLIFHAGLVAWFLILMGGSSAVFWSIVCRAFWLEAMQKRQNQREARKRVLWPQHLRGAK